MEKPGLTETFHKFSAAHPGLAAQARPLAMGAFGLVLENHDGSLTKIAFDHEAENLRARALDFLEIETNILRAFAAQPPAGFNVPVLLKEPDYFNDDTGYLAAYTMTRLPGSCASWYGDMEDNAVCNANTYESAGRTLSKLHREIASLPEHTLSGRLFRYCTAIAPIPEAGAEMAQAFAAVNNYMQPRLKPGVAHGDYHGGNLLMDENGEITGVLDFSITGKCGNHLVDLITAPANGFVDFKRGYESESGEAIDMHMMNATLLSMWVERYNCAEGDEKKFCKGKTEETLKKLAPIIHPA